MATYASSWALQVEASERWDAQPQAKAAALDADHELALACDAKGTLTLWRWPLKDDVRRPATCQRIATKRTIGGIVPSSLLHVPRRKGCFVAVFDEEKEVHAYIASSDTIVHAPLLVLEAAPTACCIHGNLGELVVAYNGAVRCHAVRGWDAQDVKAPQRLMIAVAKEHTITALASSDAAGVLIALSAKGDYWCWDAYTGQALANGAKLNGAMASTELCRAHLHAPSRVLAALERPSPKTEPTSPKQAKKMRAATMRRASTRLWFLDGAHQAEAKAKVDHRNYAPLASTLVDAETEDCCILLVADSAGTVRGWHVSQEGCVAVCCARLPQLLPMSNDGFVTVMGRGSRIVVCAGRSVISCVAHHAQSERRRGDVGEEIVALHAAGEVMVTLAKNCLRGDQAQGSLRAQPTAMDASQEGYLIGFEDGDLDIVTPASRQKGREPRRLMGAASHVSACAALMFGEREVYVAGYGSGQVCGWSKDIGSHSDFNLPQHGSSILLVQAMGTQVLIVSADGEGRVWDLSTVLDEDDGDMRFPLVGRLDASEQRPPSEEHPYGAACVLEPRKHAGGALPNLRELVLGSSTGELEVWMVPREEEESTRTIAQTCHAAAITHITAKRHGEVYALLTASDECVVRWVLDQDGLQARERFPVSRGPSSLIILPPTKGGDPDLWRFLVAYADHASLLAKRRRRDVFGRDYFITRPATPPRQQHAPFDEAQHFVTSTFRGCDVDVGALNRSRAVLLGGRESSEKPPGTPPAKIEKQVIEKDTVERKPQTPGTVLTYFGKGPVFSPEGPPAGVVTHAGDRGPRQAYPAHLAPAKATARPGTAHDEERPVTQPCSPSATLVRDAPSNTTGTQLKTVDRRVAPPLPGTNAYKQVLLKERKLGPLPPDDPRLIPHKKLSLDLKANLLPAAPLALDAPSSLLELSKIEDWRSPLTEEEGEWRPPYITSSVAEGQCNPGNELKAFSFTSSLTDQHLRKGADRARKAMRGIKDPVKPPVKPTPVEANGIEGLVFQKKKTKPKGWALLKQNRTEAQSLCAEPLGGLEADEIRALMQEKRQRLQEKRDEPIRGVRGRHWGFVFEEGVDDAERERRKRLAQLEAAARARAAAELARQLREEEEEARRLLEQQLRDQAHARSQLEAAEEEACEPDDPLEAERALLDAYDLILFEIFNSLLAQDDKKRLLPFPRLMQWPVAASGGPLGVDKGVVRDLYKQAHRCRHGGDRGNFQDFLVFARSLDAALVRSRLGPAVTAIEALVNAVEEVTIDEKASHVVRVKLSVTYDPLVEDDKDVLRQARRTPSSLDVHVLASIDVPSYDEILAGTIVEGIDGSATVDLEGLEPDRDYVAYAIVTERPPDVTHKLSKGLQDTARQLLLKASLPFRTLSFPKLGALAEGDVGIGWGDLSPEARLTELNAALKDKAVKVSIGEAGLELCKADDWKPIVRERNKDAKKRWDAWEHWWPRSGPVRRDFLEREMAFAARNPAMMEAAKAEGVVPPTADDLERAKTDPAAAQRVEAFQKWYSGAPADSDDESSFHSSEEDFSFEKAESSEEEEDVPFVRGGRAQAKKEAAHKAAFKPSSKPNDGVVEVAALKAPVPVVMPSTPKAVEEAVAEKPRKDPAAKALRVQARLAQSALRLKARTAFLGGRANKVEEVKAKIEEALANYVPPKRKHLRVYVRMIMMMLRLQRGAKEKKLQMKKPEDALPDPDDIELFGDFDEDLIINKVEERALASIENAESGEPVAPAWGSCSSQAQTDELCLACLQPDVIAAALELLVQTPEPEDWACPARKVRVEAFVAWYSTADDCRNRFFNEYETRQAHADKAVLTEAEKHKVPGLAQNTNAFKRWYAKSTERAACLARLAEREQCRRRTQACLYMTGGLPETNHNELLLLALPPLAVPARPRPPPVRYKLYPSRNDSSWSIPEILRWYSDEEKNRDRLALKKLQEDAARKFEGESWARDEAKRQEASRRGMISEDRRGASLRQAERELEQTYDTVAAFAVTVDANKAIVDVSQVFHIEERQVLLTHVPLGFEDDKGLKRTRGPGSGLTNGDEARDRIYRLDQEEKAREQAEADARRARIERARQRKLEADRQKVRDGRAQRVRANQDEVARVEAMFVEVRKLRAAQKVADELAVLDRAASRAAEAARKRLEAAAVANATLRFYAEQAIAPLLLARQQHVEVMSEEEEAEETPSECERRLEDEYIRAETQRLNDIVYAPFEPRFPDTVDDELVLRAVEPLVKQRSRDPRCVSYGELLLRTTPSIIPVLTSRESSRTFRDRQLPRLPPLSSETVIDALRTRRTVSRSGRLDAMDVALTYDGKRLALSSPRPASARKSPTKKRRALEANPLFPTRGPPGKVLRAVKAARKRVADVRKEVDIEKARPGGVRPYASFSGESFGLGGATMTIARPKSLQDLRPVVVEQEVAAEEVAGASEGK